MKKYVVFNTSFNNNENTCTLLSSPINNSILLPQSRIRIISNLRQLNRSQLSQHRILQEGLHMLILEQDNLDLVTKSVSQGLST